MTTTPDSGLDQKAQDVHRTYVQNLEAIITVQRELLDAVKGTDLDDPVRTSAIVALEVRDDEALNRERLAFLLAALIDEVARGNTFGTLIPAASEEEDK